MKSENTQAASRCTEQQFVVRDLQAGDIVQSRGSGMAYIVTANYGDCAIAVRTAHVTNPSEWILVRPNKEISVKESRRKDG